MNRSLLRRTGRLARHHRIRKRIKGTAEKPRLSIFRSHQSIYAQLIDDNRSITLLGVSSLNKEVAKAGKGEKPVALAKRVGQVLGIQAKEMGIEAVVFDRSGYKYHGRVAALAEGARENLEF